jgi:hypothetical protein
MQEREHSFRVVDHRALEFDNSRLCDVLYWSGSTRGPDQEESRANARLIAAAPDLLEVLQWFQDQMACEVIQIEKIIDEMPRRARAAIMKAVGDE